MENQKVFLFRQKNRWGLTVLSILVCFIISPLVGMTAMMPQVLAFVPVIALALLAYVGPVSAVMCTDVLVGMGGTLYGLYGLLGAIILFVPMLLIGAALADKRVPFWQSAGVGTVTMFVSMGAVIGMLTVAVGKDVVTMYTELVREVFGNMGALSDSLLMMMMQMGVLPVQDGLDLSSPVAAMTPQMREELINMIVYVMDTGLRLELPAQMTTGAVMAGVMGQVVLRKGMRAHGSDVPYLQLRKWRLPKGWGRVLGGTLLVFFIAANAMPERMNSTFYVFSQMFDLVFAVQGIAAVCYMLHKKGRGRGLKFLVCVAGFFFLRSIALAIGIADQGMDITGRRAELDAAGNPYDPFGRKPEA